MNFDPGPWRPHRDALCAYHRGRGEATIVVYDDYGDRDEVPVSWFFRGPADFPEAERVALEACRGTVLDVGAGAGVHSLALQDRGTRVIALEVLPELVALLRDRGVQHARLGTLADVAERVDTVLMLMNGLGLAGTLDGLPRMLDELRRVLRPGGQVIADSTDVRAAYADGGTEREDGRYVGEMVFQLEFDGRRGGPFPQVYVDPDTLRTVASGAGWTMELLWQAAEGGYVARLQPVEGD